jgi:hypothetical protein
MPTTRRKPSEWFLRTFEASRLAGKMAQALSEGADFAGDGQRSDAIVATSNLHW